MSDGWPLLTMLIALPLLGAVLLPFMRGWPNQARLAALLILLLESGLIASILIKWPMLQISTVQFPLFEDHVWIRALGARYQLGMDGISLLMVALSVLSAFLGLFLVWRSKLREQAICISLIFLALSGIIGVFLALDLLLFYLFWELMLLPVFVLIGWWGSERPIAAAMRFMLMAIAGSLALLLAIGATYIMHIKGGGEATFSLLKLSGALLSADAQLWLAAAFLLAFMLKIPLIPFHFWQPDAYRSAPPAVTLLLAMVMAKTGGYALLRFVPAIFPLAFARAEWLLYLLGLISIIIAGLVAYAQQDIKRLLAWSSIGHLGFVVIGIATWRPVPVSGAVLHMLNHGVTTGALFLMAAMLEQRAGTMDRSAFGGLWGRMPVFSFFFLFFSLASLGLPGLNNFVGEFLVLAGSFKGHPLVVGLAFIGVILPLVYMTRLMQGLLFGPSGKCADLADLDLKEVLLLLVLAVLDLYLGVHPAPVLELLEQPVMMILGGAA